MNLQTRFALEIARAAISDEVEALTPLRQAARGRLWTVFLSIAMNSVQRSA